jgi:protein-L-isoaspartate(D-aspartate) O-methyltransferase
MRMTPVEILQEAILKLTQAKGAPQPISAATAAAFRVVPRHRFVRRFLRGGEPVTVTPENLGEHLATIYKNDALGLWSDQAQGLFSTISQPTLVLLMLELLKLEAGHTVFELGAGSGWNAAMMGHIVGPAGRVFSSEIIPEMARSAEESVADFGSKNVRIVTGDGGDGHAAGAPYDRMVFTAGSSDLPLAFHEQIREGGLLLMVLKITGGGDQLVLFERKHGYFESRRMSPCAFVPMTGPLASSPQPEDLDALPTGLNSRSGSSSEGNFGWWATTRRAAGCRRLASGSSWA